VLRSNLSAAKTPRGMEGQVTDDLLSRHPAVFSACLNVFDELIEDHSQAQQSQKQLAGNRSTAFRTADHAAAQCVITLERDRIASGGAAGAGPLRSSRATGSGKTALIEGLQEWATDRGARLAAQPWSLQWSERRQL
jgi:hypothetical protein